MRDELVHLVNYAIAVIEQKSSLRITVSQARIVYPSPGLRPPPPLQRGGQMQEKELRRNSDLSRELLLICFVHPVLLVLRLAELAALSYGSGVIIAQVVKVRLVAVIMRLNFYAILLHSKFSSLTVYKNIIAGNSDLSKNFLLLLNVIQEDKITLDFLEFLQIFKRFSGETMLELVFCGKNARLSREKCRKNARNFIF